MLSKCNPAGGPSPDFIDLPWVTSRKQNLATERVQTLADISGAALYAFAVYKAISLHTFVVIATKPVHRLQIRPKVHNWASPTLPQVISGSVQYAVVWECGDGQTDTQMAVANVHFASAMPHANVSNELKFITAARR